jgi:hypothetical protein
MNGMNEIEQHDDEIHEWNDCQMICDVVCCCLLSWLMVCVAGRWLEEARTDQDRGAGGGMKERDGRAEALIRIR